MSLYATAVKKPVTTALVFVAIVIFGLFSLTRLSVDLLPEIETNTIMVMTSYAGASAADIEMNVSKPLEKTGNDFGVELPEEIDSDLSDMTITTEMLEEADTLKDMNLPKGTLVMIVKRGDEFLIPNGTLKLHVGDKLLLISEKSKEEVNESE